MSIQSDIVTALASVAVHDGYSNVYPDAAPEMATEPLVIMRRTDYEPIMTLTGPEGTARSDFVFECWGAKSATTTAKASALATAVAVRAAIEASSTLKNKYQIPVTGEDFDPDTLEMMEPVAFTFWHVA